MRPLPSSRTVAVAIMATAFGLAPILADARPGVRGGASTSISRGGGGMRGGGGINNSGKRVNNGGNRVNNGHINSGNNNRINTGDVNINVNNNNGWNDWNDHYHPVARAAAVGVAVGVTAAVVAGSRYYALPPGCSPYPYGGYAYYNCGNVYYETRYEGDKVVYVVVNNPG